MIDGTTKLLGVMGWPVEHSLSPVMQNAAIRAAGINACYVPLPCPPGNLGRAVAGLRAVGFAGANVTIPHKQAIIEHLDGLTDESRFTGSVNTLYWQGDRLMGTTTDAAGAVSNLRQAGVELDGRRVTLLGTGGAARALAFALARGGGAGQTEAMKKGDDDERGGAAAGSGAGDPGDARPLDAPGGGAVADAGDGADTGADGGAVPGAGRGAAAFRLTELTLLGRDRGKSERLAREAAAGSATDTAVRSGLLAEFAECGRDADLIINCTSAGMAPDAGRCPIDPRLLEPRHVVHDIVYRPRETVLLREAKRKGCRTVEGIGMLVHQGAASFRSWFGRDADTTVMFEALEPFGYG